MEEKTKISSQKFHVFTIVRLYYNLVIDATVIKTDIVIFLFIYSRLNHLCFGLVEAFFSFESIKFCIAILAGKYTNGAISQ